MSNTDVTRFIALCQPRLRAFIRSMVFNSSDVDDILQDVAVIAIENSDRFDSSRSLEAWVLGIARKRILKYFEKHKRRKVCFSNEMVDAMTDLTLQAPEADGALESLQECLSKLDQEKRELLLRRHKPGTTSRALAREIGYTDTRMSRLFNGLYATLLKCVQQRLAAGI